MSAGRARAGGVVAAVAAAGLAIGFAAGWWQGGRPADPASLEDETAAAMAMVHPIERRRAMLAVLARLRPATLPAIRAGVLRESTFGDACALQLFAAAWAAFDPVAAFESAGPDWEMKLRQSAITAEAAYALARAGRSDEAIELASTLRASAERRPTFASIAEGMIRRGDLEGATGLLVETARSSTPLRMIERFLKTFVLQRDPEGLIAWAERIPGDAPKRLRPATLKLAARWLTSVDPARAAAWVEAGADREEGLREARSAVAEEWVERDPEAAIAWITAHTTPGERPAAMAGVLRRFIAHRPTRAAEWLARDDTPADYVAPVIPSLARELMGRSPADALAWVQRIPDASHRDEMIVSVGRSWWAQDPEAARAWLVEHGVPEALRREIEAPDPRRRAGR